MGFLPPLDVLARAPLLPVLAWQGVSVRRNALILPEAAGPRSGKAGQGPQIRLLILGDSSAAGVGVTEQSEALSGQLVTALAKERTVVWELIARTGATTPDALAMLDGAQLDRYDVVVLALGVNDAVRLVRISKWLRQQKALRQSLRTRFGVGAIVATAVPPLGVFPALPPLLRWVLGAHAERMGRALAEELSKEKDAIHLAIDVPFTREAMAVDGYHPSAATNTLWGERAAHCILSHI